MKLLIAPEPILSKVSKPVKKNEDISGLVEDMKATILEWEQATKGEVAVAMAAIQIGVPKRVMIVRDLHNKKRSYSVWLNPVITKYSDDGTSSPEGCMSLPGRHDYKLRSNAVAVKAQDISGNQKQFVLEGILAIVFQHEVDHMNGKLFTDKTLHVKLDRSVKKGGDVITKQ